MKKALRIRYSIQVNGLLLLTLIFLAPISLQAKEKTLVLMGINDLHGNLLAQTFTADEPSPGSSLTYDRGGAELLSAHVRVLRKEFGDRFFILDAGDEFSGSIESDSKEGAPVVQFLNSIQLTASALGNHEFDYGLNALKRNSVDARYPILSANVEGLPWILPSAIFTISGIKVGVIGLTTQETPESTSKDAVASLRFSHFDLPILREAHDLRKKGAKIIILVAHAGLEELSPSLEKVPDRTVDAVVLGHTHTIVHQMNREVPWVEAGSNGFYYNLVYLTYDLKSQKLVPNKSRIEGPIPVCSKVFSIQKNCDVKEPAPLNGRGQLIEPILHGQPVKVLDSDRSLISNSIGRDVQKFRKKIRTLSVTLENRPPPGRADCTLGNFVADTIKDRLKADFSLINQSGFRSDLRAGEINYVDVYRALPFSNRLIRMRLTGKELRAALSAAETKGDDFFSVSGLKLILKKNTGSSGYTLTSVTLSDGTPLLEDHYYTLATVDFLAKGGSRMESTLGKLPADRWQDENWGLLRDSIVESLTVKNPLVSPEDHRLELEP